VLKTFRFLSKTFRFFKDNSKSMQFASGTRWITLKHPKKPCICIASVSQYF